jgi:hypothetical protein
MRCVENRIVSSKLLSKFDVLNLLRSLLLSKLKISNYSRAGEQAVADELQFERNLAPLD